MLCFVKYFLISTHSLTRRLTIIRLLCNAQQNHFNSQPHKEADKAATFFPIDFGYFNSQPHKEADDKGGAFTTWSMGFQLTASQGG